MNDAKAKATASARGIGFGGLLTIVFIVLKLMHIIDWSWWWVLAPIWIPIIFWIVVIVILYKLVS